MSQLEIKKSWATAYCAEWNLSPEEANILLNGHEGQEPPADHYDSIHEIKCLAALTADNQMQLGQQDKLNKEAAWLRTPFSVLGGKSPLQFAQENGVKTLALATRRPGLV